MSDNEKLKLIYLNDDEEALHEVIADEYVEANRDKLEAQASDLSTPEAIEEKERTRVKELLKEPSYEEQLVEATILLTKKHQDILSEEEREMIKEGIETIMNHSLKQQCGDPQFNLVNYLEGKELYEFFGLSTDYMIAVNKLAKTYLEKGEARKGFVLYSYLSLLDSIQSCYWHGLGMSLAMQDDHNGAIPIFETAFAMDSEDIFPLLSLIESYIACNSLKEAEEAIIQAHEVYGNYPEKNSTWRGKLDDLKMKIRSQ